MSYVADETVAAIDVAKETFQACVMDANERCLHNSNFTYDAPGVAQLLALLHKHQVTAVILEATGGLERTLMAEVAAVGIRVVRANPRHARDFAKAMGHLAKTDKIDAPTLALMLRRLRLEAKPLPSAQQQELSELTTRRHQLVSMCSAEKNRAQQAPLKDVRNDIRDNIKSLERRINKLDKAIQALIDANSDWANKAKILDSAPGVGTATANALVAHLPEIGTLNKQQIAALAGLAPFNRDSGGFCGSRSIWGGRATVRCALYMAALSAATHNPKIKVFYDRLLAKGKLAKVALTACMRKLLVMMNTMVKNGTVWNPINDAVTA